MNQAKILYGVCGIGLGHTFRQLPLIERLALHNRIVIFAYGESLRFFTKHFANHPRVSVEHVSVPFYVGDRNGLDFAATAQRAATSEQNHLGINCAAMAAAQKQLGKPDLVISDYEPVCAQYAYATGAQLVTIDQQSKYLIGDFAPDLRGESYNDEVARLRMFFPQVHTRIACSFFAVPQPKDGYRMAVTVRPPILKPELRDMQRKPKQDGNSILVYVSSQQAFVQPMTEVVRALTAQKGCEFHAFLPQVDTALEEELRSSNVRLYKHGDTAFNGVLEQCTGMITTGGHSLLSEAMHLGIPAYVVPLPVYEQQMNAHVVGSNGFGVSHTQVAEAEVRKFLADLPLFAAAIKADRKVLLRGCGASSIIHFLRHTFLGGFNLG